MVLNNQIHGISKQVDRMLLALQRDKNKENEKVIINNEVNPVSYVIWMIYPNIFLGLYRNLP